MQQQQLADYNEWGAATCAATTTKQHCTQAHLAQIQAQVVLLALVVDGAGPFFGSFVPHHASGGNEGH